MSKTYMTKLVDVITLEEHDQIVEELKQQLDEYLGEYGERRDLRKTIQEYGRCIDLEQGKVKMLKDEIKRLHEYVIGGYEEMQQEMQSRITKLERNLAWLVDHAIETASISRAKGAELLGVPLIDLINIGAGLPKTHCSTDPIKFDMATAWDTHKCYNKEKQYYTIPVSGHYVYRVSGSVELYTKMCDAGDIIKDVTFVERVG